MKQRSEVGWGPCYCLQTFDLSGIITEKRYAACLWLAKVHWWFNVRVSEVKHGKPLEAVWWAGTILHSSKNLAATKKKTSCPLQSSWKSEKPNYFYSVLYDLVCRYKH